jgi:GntR family transcriptional repressor for pyruvate dehydrogenase complex
MSTPMSTPMLSWLDLRASTAAMPRPVQLFEKVRARRTYEEVASRIRRSFIDGNVKAGDKLPEDAELVRHLGVSRGALKDALRALEVAGVIELRTGRNGGAYVSAGKPKILSDNMVDLLHLRGVTIAQLTEARIWIEDIVVRVACARATEDDLTALDANIAVAKTLFEQGRLPEKAAANIDFHNILAQATKNPLLMIIMSTLTEVISAFVRETQANAGAVTFSSRKRFMAALRARDAEAAVEEMRRSLRRLHRLYEKLALEKTQRTASVPAPKVTRRTARKSAGLQR